MELVADAELDAAFDAVFGPAPTSTAWVRFANDTGNGVPIVVRLPVEAQERAMSRYVGSLQTQEEKDEAWLNEPIIHALVSIGGKPVPEDVEYRRKLVGKWWRPIRIAILDRIQHLDADELAAMQAIANAKNHRGARSGQASAPEAAGPTDRSPSPSSRTRAS